MSDRPGTLGDVYTDAWLPAGMVVPDFVPTGWTDIDFTDIFAGAGGSSIGLVAAGLNLKLAANHSRRAITTHAENFVHAEHLIADVTNYDMRKLPRTQVHFRMVEPRESARAQRFPDNYRLTGNQGEQQLQAGNAVSSNVSQWLGAITVQVLS